MTEYAPHNAMDDPGEIARFYDRGSDLMRTLLDGLAQGPHRPRPFPQIEESIGWPRRRIAAVLGGAGRMRVLEFDGRRPYRFLDERAAASGRWEMWMDSGQARAVRAAAAAELRERPAPGRSASARSRGQRPSRSSRVR
jgi:hypothetical protein